MWLHDSEDWRYENPEALEAARRVLTLGRLVPEDRLSKLDLYLPMFWAWAGKVLIRELRRLENIGEYLCKYSFRCSWTIAMSSRCPDRS
jgi:hypothetical protein